MKSIKITSLLAVGLIAMSVVVFSLARGHSNGAEICPKIGTTHVVTIQNGHASPENTYGKPCDKLEIINGDKVDREMAFGPHEHHQAYDGVVERLLQPGQSLTVTMVQAGLFHFHDHIHDDSEGYFTVSR